MTTNYEIRKGKMTTQTLKDVRTEAQIAAQAKELYEWTLRFAEVNKWELTTNDGVSGYEGELVMRGVCTKIWPQYSGELRRAELDAFIQPIYRYLRASGNAACVYNPALEQRKAAPVWFVSQKWSTAKPVSVPHFTNYKSTADVPNSYNSGKLSSSIGDLMRPDAAAKMVEMAKAAQAKAKTKRVKATTVADYIEVVMLESKHPLTAEEVLFSLRTENVQASDWSVRLNLSALIETGSVSIRTETEPERILRTGGLAGRFAQLYAHGDHVPERTVGKLFNNMVEEARDSERPAGNGNTDSASGLDPRVERIGQLVTELVDEATLELRTELEALKGKLRSILG